MTMETRMAEKGESRRDSVAFEFEEFEVDGTYFYVEGYFQYTATAFEQGLPVDYSETLVIEQVQEWMSDDCDDMREMDETEALAWAKANEEALVERHSDDMVGAAEDAAEYAMERRAGC